MPGKRGNAGRGKVPKRNHVGIKPSDFIAQTNGDSNEEKEDDHTDDLADLFERSPLAQARIAKVRARNKKSNARVRSKPSFKINITASTRDDGEPSDKELAKWDGRQLSVLFSATLPDQKLVTDLGVRTIKKSFDSLLNEILDRGGSKRGAVAITKYLAKNIRSICKGLKLPTADISIRRLMAYRNTFLDQMPNLLLLEGSASWILVSDSYESFEVDITTSISLVQIDLYALGMEDTFRFKKEVLFKMVKNIKILNAIEEAMDE